MTVAADLLPAIPAPPHDPTWLRLSADLGWRLADACEGVEIDPGDGTLVLAPAPGSLPDLTLADGGFGGLIAPRTVTVDGGGTVWLFDRATATLKRLDACACVFTTVPCLGCDPTDPRWPKSGQAILANGERLYIADANPVDPRVLVLALPQLALVAILRPRGALAASWRPVALAQDRHQRLLVADPANGMIHRFSRHGRWLSPSWSGLGAVSNLTVDPEGRIYLAIPSETSVRVLTPDGNESERLDRIERLAERLGPSTIRLDAEGRLVLDGFCAGVEAPVLFGIDGSPRPGATETLRASIFVAVGSYVSQALDSGISRCVWHRLRLTADLTPGTRVEMATLTAEVAQPEALIAALPESAWTLHPGFEGAGSREALILGAPGRYLWLKLRLHGRGGLTPRVRRVDLEFPRVSLRRFLPAAFGEEPVAADFTDRLLALFDTGFREIESLIDRQAGLYEPRSAPSTSPKRGRPDFLGWLASWVGLALDPRLPEAKRRRLLAEAPRLYACRGTLTGLKRLLDLYLGLEERTCSAKPCPWGPRCPPSPATVSSPPLILEHFRLRRWLFLGAGRLGGEARLWGQRIVNRSQLDDGARLGSSQLKTTPDPLHDPFLVHAHTFSVFLPTGAGRDERQRRALDRLIAAEKPAHTRHIVHYVAGRFRVGVQATVGFDSAVGDYPKEGVRLDQDRLGRGTLLTGERPGNANNTMTVGRGTRVGVTTRLD